MKSKMNPEKLYNYLYDYYGPQGWWPLTMSRRNNYERDQHGYHHNNPLVQHSAVDQFEIISGVVLTQNTSWKNVEICIRKLKENKVTSAEVFLEKDEKLIKDCIRSSGYYNQKYEKLKLVFKYLLDNRHINSDPDLINEINNNVENISRDETLFNRSCIVPERDKLLELWGIGEESADSILLYAYNIPAFVIDNYTKRITDRIFPEVKLNRYSDYKKYYEDSIEKNSVIYNEYHALIVKISIEFCKKTPGCKNCFMKNHCNFRL